MDLPLVGGNDLAQRKKAYWTLKSFSNITLVIICHIPLFYSGGNSRFSPSAIINRRLFTRLTYDAHNSRGMVCLPDTYTYHTGNNANHEATKPHHGRKIARQISNDQPVMSKRMEMLIVQVMHRYYNIIAQRAEGLGWSEPNLSRLMVFTIYSRYIQTWMVIIMYSTLIFGHYKVLTRHSMCFLHMTCLPWIDITKCLLM